MDIGYEHRGENVSFAPDAAELSGDLSGFGSASVAINNGVSVAEEFAELRAPLVQNKAGVKDLLFDTGIRHSNYSSVGSVNTYKFEVQFAPVADYRLRASFDRAIRAPNIIELYNPQLGSVALDLNGAYLMHTDTQPFKGAHTYDCAGYYGGTCETINFRWHHILRATWRMPCGIGAALTWRYLGPVSLDTNSPDPTLNNGSVDYVDARIPAINYFDFEATWDATSVLTLRAGINKLLDKDPPIVANTIVPGGAANTYPVYDMFGRELFAGFSARF